MTNQLKKFSALWAVCLLMASAPALAIPTLVFQPANQTVDLGSDAAVDVFVTGLSGELVGSYDFSVAWDSALLGLDSVSFGSGLSPSISDFVPGTGNVNVFEVGLGALPQDGLSSFRLFTLVFDTLGVGTSALSFIGNIAPDLGFLGDDLGNLLATDTQAGSITIRPGSTPVPEPAMLSMLLVGLGAFGALRTRRLQKNTRLS